MSGAMHKIRVKAVTRQNPLGGAIDISATWTRRLRSHGGRLGFVNRAIPSPYACGCASHKDSARNIAAIVAEYSTQVQHDQFIFPQSPSGRPRVRVGGALSKGHDGFEGRLGGPALPHLVLNFRGDLQLAYARLEQLENGSHNLRG